MKIFLTITTAIVFYIIVAIPVFYLISFIFDRQTHKKLTKNNCDKFGYANFKKFKEEFDKIKWQHNNDFYQSLFFRNFDDKIISEIHADIYMFDNIGMIMNNTFNYWRSVRYINKYIKTNYPKLHKKANYNWNK